ncbi:MAG: glycosyltransferase [Desulfobacterales bacterium]|nr:MAG: glycosyltransferase [Desulfobacterales bacterium]
MRNHRPKISVYTTCKNSGHYLRATLHSIFSQSFQDFEIILVDAQSTDDTSDILKSYGTERRLRWISEADDSQIEGLHKALALARGDYVMFMPISDVYLEPTWFEQCVEVLDHDRQISLVHGNVLHMGDDGAIGASAFPQWQQFAPPSGYEFLPYWLATFCFISELTYCVRRDVYRTCMPSYRGQRIDFASMQWPLSDEDFAIHGPHLKLLFNFNHNGYLPFYLPVDASAARNHPDALSRIHQRYLQLEAAKYTADIVDFREALLAGSILHVFRDGRSNRICKLEGRALQDLAEKVRHYRVNGHIMFGYVEKLNVEYQKKKELFEKKWAEWTGRFGKHSPVAIYGAGQHTELLLAAVGRALATLNLVAIVDRNPARSRLAGIPVQRAQQFDFQAVAHIIISSKAFEAEIFDELRAKVPCDRIERIYS